ncbi:MAG: hypothetical protein RBT33_01205 [Candidatus Dojkabacteria bacterium]|jgi:hypothetical protein|nr:hypothetical protein [Candidatus Dojkabacteria bacterium]
MKKYIGKKNILAVIAGILFTGLILNTINEISPTEVISSNQASLLNIKQENIKSLDSNEIKERILEEAVSTRVENSESLIQVENVRVYLTKRNSPLAQYAQEIVDAANQYGIDYRLLAAISIVESSGGIHTFRTHNAWGWGKKNFSSWQEGILAVSKGLGNYYSRGLNTPQKISVYYCPPSAGEWARKVSFVMREIGE